VSTLSSFWLSKRIRRLKKCLAIPAKIGLKINASPAIFPFVLIELQSRSTLYYALSQVYGKYLADKDAKNPPYATPMDAHCRFLNV
jgi:hypothetical protein